MHNRYWDKSSNEHYSSIPVDIVGPDADGNSQINTDNVDVKSLHWVRVSALIQATNPTLSRDIPQQVIEALSTEYGSVRTSNGCVYHLEKMFEFCRHVTKALPKMLKKELCYGMLTMLTIIEMVCICIDVTSTVVKHEVSRDVFLNNELYHG